MREGQRSLYRRLLAAGVKIWEYQPSMMHAKTVLVDDRLALAGSIEPRPALAQHARGGCADIEDPSAAAELAAGVRARPPQSKSIEPGSKEIPGFWGTLVREAFRRVGKAPGR